MHHGPVTEFMTVVGQVRMVMTMVVRVREDHGVDGTIVVVVVVAVLMIEVMRMLVARAMPVAMTGVLSHRNVMMQASAGALRRHCDALHTDAAHQQQHAEAQARPSPPGRQSKR